ncbi:hypothetical protein Ahy_A01g000651 isoform B [Arachis hypogaea]|uniref:Uncharacterized protein n=1 Tax=Arachis hypogaea TaxID=3818 RepID=A0A445EKS7_ARAHY|nr:hypothetical protein Ahy_A01g000651 isoform B [Arachis hypogaea]
MGQLAQRMEKSTNFFSSDTIPNPQEECKAIYLRNGKVVREEKEETKESSDKQGKEATEDIIQQEEHVTPTILFVDRKYEEALFQYELALQVALNMSSSVEVHMKRILEIDPSNDQARKGICRLEPLAAEKREKMKEEMMDKIVHGHAFRKLPVYFASTENLRKRGLLQLFRLQRWKLCILMHIRVFINMVTEIARMEFLEFIKGSRDVNGAGRGMPPCSPSSPPELIPIPARSPSWGDNCPHPHSPRSPYSPQGPIPHPLMFNIHKFQTFGELSRMGRGSPLGSSRLSRENFAPHPHPHGENSPQSGPIRGGPCGDPRLLGIFDTPTQIMIGGGKTVKAKIKSVKSKDEGESLKFTHKNLIDKICTDSADAKIPAVLEYLGTFIETCCIKATIGYRFPGRGLYQGSCVIFAELSWTPGYLFQAEDRAHRIGKVSPVNIYYLLANDTVDDIIWDVVQFKLDNLGLMLDGHENTLAVSNNQPLSSPAKHTTIEHSPLRQRTLDQFVRRCDNADRSEHQPDPKRPC